MKKINIYIVLILSFCIGLYSCTKKYNWVNTFTFFEEVGYFNLKEDSPIQWEYNLKVSPETLNKYNIAFLHLCGYEIENNINCLAEIDGNELKVYFDSYDETKQNNKLDYKKNDLLFVLKCDDDKLETDWKKLKPKLKLSEENKISFLLTKKASIN